MLNLLVCPFFQLHTILQFHIRAQQTRSARGDGFDLRRVQRLWGESGWIIWATWSSEHGASLFTLRCFCKQWNLKTSARLHQFAATITASPLSTRPKDSSFVHDVSIRGCQKPFTGRTQHEDSCSSGVRMNGEKVQVPVVVENGFRLSVFGFVCETVTASFLKGQEGELMTNASEVRDPACLSEKLFLHQTWSLMSPLCGTSGA